MALSSDRFTRRPSDPASDPIVNATIDPASDPTLDPATNGFSHWFGDWFSRRLPALLAEAEAGWLLGLMIPVGLALSAFPFRSNAVLLHLGASPLTVALLGGLLLANLPFFHPTDAAERGIQFVQKRVLRWGIVLYGLRLSFQDVQSIGVKGILIDVVMIVTTFVLGSYAGMRWFKLDHHSAMLNAAGSSICGAAAVIATESVLKSDARKTTMAVGTVVLFGTLSMVLYPILYRTLSLSASAFAYYTGSTVHEVAQVVAVADAVGDPGTAIIMKMTRVLMLAPFLLILGWWNRQEGGELQSRNVAVPYFAFGFLLLAGFHSLVTLPQPLYRALLDLDTLMLSAAMAGLGLGTSYHRLKGLGWPSILHGAALWTWLLVGGYALNTLVG